MRGLFFIALVACGSSEPACPSPPLSFASDVQPALEATCSKCHAATVRGANRQGAPREAVYDTQEQVQGWLPRIIQRAKTDMPPATSTLPKLDVSVLQTWSECGAAP
jgi:uncharacterized membrane protein